jgi:hypothetical protein
VLVVELSSRLMPTEGKIGSLLFGREVVRVLFEPPVWREYCDNGRRLDGGIFWVS